MTQPTSQDLLMGGGGKSWSWAVLNPQTNRYDDKPVGTTVEGYISGPIGDPTQQTDIQSKALLTWPDGKPKLQIVIPLATQLREDAEDDGNRGLFVKQSSPLQAAIRDAVKESGAQALSQGGYLKVTFVGTKPSSTVGNAPIKLFQAWYTPPAQGVVMDGSAQQPAQGYQPQAPQQGQYAPAQPQPQYAPQQPAQGYQPQAPQQGQYAPAGAPPAQPQPQYAPQPPTQPPAQPQFQPPQAPAPQQAPAGAPQQGQNPFEVARKLLHEMKLPPEQVAAATGLTVEQVNQVPAF